MSLFATCGLLILAVAAGAWFRKRALYRKLYRQAVEQGDASAQYAIGMRYAEGLGVQRDDITAVAWFRKAAEQGHADAQDRLRIMYAEGRGVPPDAAEAVAWFNQAVEVERCHADAQFILGRMYAAGAPKKDTEAGVWFRQARAPNSLKRRAGSGYSDPGPILHFPKILQPEDLVKFPRDKPRLKEIFSRRVGRKLMRRQVPAQNCSRDPSRVPRTWSRSCDSPLGHVSHFSALSCHNKSPKKAHF